MRCWLLTSALLLLASSAIAGNNEGGVLILHANPALSYTDGVDYCGQSGLTDIASARTTLPWIVGVPTVCHVIAAFPAGSTQRMRGVEFGVGYDDTHLSIIDHHQCGSAEFPGNGWPGPYTENEVIFDPVSTSSMREVYWFAAYVDGEAVDSTVFGLAPHRDHEARFGDDSTPSVLDPVMHLGALGFGTAGTTWNPCVTSPPEMTESRRVYWTDGDPISFVTPAGTGRVQWGPNPNQDPMNESNRAMLFHQDKTDERAEHLGPQLPTDESTYRYKWMFYLPQIFKDVPRTWRTLVGWQTNPCTAVGDSTFYTQYICGGPYNGGFDDLIVTPANHLELRLRAIPDCDNFFTPLLDSMLDRWLPMQLDVYWTRSSNGWLRFWIDNALVFERCGIRTLWDRNGSFLPQCNIYFRIGQYAPWPGACVLSADSCICTAQAPCERFGGAWQGVCTTCSAQIPCTSSCPDSINIWADNMSIHELSPTWARTVKVNGSGDYPCIQAAIDAAPAVGGKIILGAGTYIGNGNYNLQVVHKSCEILSESGTPENTIIDASGLGRVFNIVGDTLNLVRISGVTIANGHALSGADSIGGGVLVHGSTTWFSNCVFTGNLATSRGAAVHATGPAVSMWGIPDIEFTDCVVSSNGSRQHPSCAVFTSGYQLVNVVQSVFFGNTGRTVACLDSWCQTRLAQCTIYGNKSVPSPSGAADAVVIHQTGWIDRTIIASDSTDAMGWDAGVSWVTLSCTDIWGNLANWEAPWDGQLQSRDNVSLDPRFCMATPPPLISSTSWCAPGNSPCGWIGAGVVGCTDQPTRATSVGGSDWSGLRVLGQMPFAGSVDFLVIVSPEEGRKHVTLTIFDVAGHEIREVADREMGAGSHRVSWDGQDRHGRDCPSGVYFCRFAVGGTIGHRRLLMMR